MIPSERRAVVKAQREWAETVAQGIERGELPEAAHDREAIAWILRDAAAQLSANLPARPGNPAFITKLPSADAVALMVHIEIKRGAIKSLAIGIVADRFCAKESSVRKIYKRLGIAVASDFPRVHFLGQGKRRRYYR
jgi:hypothetical protein